MEAPAAAAGTSAPLKVCVIGAGPAGLACLKEAHQCGFEAVSFEKASGIGGAFYQAAEDKKGSIMYESLKLTISNTLMAFSDFPPSESDLRSAGGVRYLWTWREYLDYLDAYVHRFDIADKIRLRHEVQEVRRCEDGVGWEVTVRAAATGTVSTTRYDAVAVCAGTHQQTKRPHWQGEETFTGEIKHSATYYDPTPFVGKKVLLVGLGESGAELANEIGAVADEMHVALRRYNLTMPRNMFPEFSDKKAPDGFASDVASSRAFYGTSAGLLDFQNKWLMKAWSKGRSPVTGRRLPKEQREAMKLVGRHNLLANGAHKQLLPDGQAVTKNDGFHIALTRGNAVRKPSIDHIEGSAVVYADLSTFEPDIIVACTGYKPTFPFLASVTTVPDIQQLYKHIIHPEIGHTLGFLGYARPTGGGLPAVAEMGCRLWCELLKGAVVLPPTEQLKVLVAEEAQAEKRKTKISGDLSTLVPYHSYMDSLATLIGALPTKLLLLKHRIFGRAYVGTQLPAFYRLRGPNAAPKVASKEIREALMVPPLVRIVNGAGYLGTRLFSIVGIGKMRTQSLPWW